MTLNQKILDAARDEVAKRYGYSNWQTALSSFELATHYHNEAALLAMEKQAEFYEWTQLNNYRLFRIPEREYWYSEGCMYDDHWTTEQLYNIWEGQK